MVKEETQRMEKEKKEKEQTQSEENLVKLLETLGEISDAKLIRQIEEYDLDPNYKFKDGSYLIHKAINGEHLKFFKKLIDKGANIKMQDKFGDTPLHEAALLLSHTHDNKKTIEFIRMLIENNANLDIQNEFGQTPFHIIASASNYLPERQIVEAVNILIAGGANLSIKDKNGDTPKDLLNRDTNLFKVLDNSKISTEKQINELIKYFKNDEKKFLELMSTLKLSVNIGLERDLYLENEDKIKRLDPALSLAIETGKIQIFNELIKRDAKVNLVNKAGEAPLHFAAKFYEKNKPEETEKRINMIKILIEKNANINTKDENGNRPVDLQIQNQDSKIYKYLQELTERNLLGTIEKYKTQETLNTRDKNILTDILFYDAWHGNIKILRELIDIGFDMNTQNPLGLTPLHKTVMGKKNVKDLVEAEERYNKAIELLILQGNANPEIKDYNGKTAKDLTNRDSITRKLIEECELKNFFNKIK